MAKSRRSPLSYCDYSTADHDYGVEVACARRELIETVGRVLPVFLSSLAEHVFPHYRKLAEGNYDFDRVLWVPTRVSAFKTLDENGLKVALRKWASQFNISADWMIDQALRTLRLWNVSPEHRQNMSWDHTSVTSGGLTGPPFEFVCGGWEATLLSWQSYSDSVRRRFEQYLREYEQITRDLADEQGLVRSRRTYSPHNLEWFALYQFAALSSGQIADWTGKQGRPVDESSVLKGIKMAAKLIAWPRLRSNRKVR